jgi:lipoprotein-anchoring transpeptidase ErfK/SrfK
MAKNKKGSNLLVLGYAFSIVLMGVVFLLQSNGIKTVKSQDTSKTNIGSETVKDNSNIQDSFLLPEENIYTYDVVDKSANPKIKIGEKTVLSLKIRNTGNQTWISSGDNPTYLGTTRSEDRETVFYKEGNRGWFSGNRIMMDKKTVRPGQTVNFTFQITAPEKSGIYREFFTPIIEKVKWLDDKNISWDIEVKNPSKPDEELKTTISGGPIKYINIKIKEQNLYAMENGLAKYVFRTSTGIAGMDTPTGKYKIWNKFPVQYSAPYELYMDNWMAITPDGAYGIHSLPYWLYKNGSRVYEGEEHLGTPVSHGCIRTSLENSKTLYDWAEVGMQVIIEN